MKAKLQDMRKGAGKYKSECTERKLLYDRNDMVVCWWDREEKFLRMKRGSLLPFLIQEKGVNEDFVLKYHDRTFKEHVQYITQGMKTEPDHSGRVGQT